MNVMWMCPLVNGMDMRGYPLDAFLSLSALRCGQLCIGFCVICRYCETVSVKHGRTAFAVRDGGRGGGGGYHSAIIVLSDGANGIGAPCVLFGLSSVADEEIAIYALRDILGGKG